MKFIISNQSLWDGTCESYCGEDEDYKPHPLAKREMLTYLDWRTTKTLEEARTAFMNLHGSWFAEGENHREENGMVVREIQKEFWTYEMILLEDLIQFMYMYGNFEIMKSVCKEVPVEIIFHQ